MILTHSWQDFMVTTLLQLTTVTNSKKTDLQK